MSGVPRLPPGTVPIWTVLALTLGGRTRHFAARSLTIESDDGDLPVFGGLLRCPISEPGTVGGGSGSASISFEALWPVPFLDDLAAGARAGAMTAEVSRWRDGTTWEERRVVLGGAVRSPMWGSAEEPVAGTVEALVEDASLIQEPLARVSAQSWRTNRYADSDEGRVYPVLLGYPGKDPQVSVGWHTAFQLVYGEAEANWQVGILGIGPIEATECYINSDGDPGGELVTITHRTDHLGRTLAVVDYNLQGYGTGAANDLGTDLNPGTTNPIAIYGGFHDGGGLLGPDGRVIRRAGDVLRWACGRFQRRRLDRGRLAAAATLLQGFFIDGTIDAETKVSDWLSGSLLPLLPCSMEQGGRGVYPVVWRFSATERDAVAHLDVDSGVCSRTSRITSDTDDIRNDLALQYGYSARTKRYLYTARVGAAVEEYATVILEGYLGDRIRLRARWPGSRGAGIVVSYVDNGALGVIVVTEDTEAKTIVIEGNNAVCTALGVVTALAGSDLVVAEILAGTGDHYFQAGADMQERDYTLALRRTAGQVGSARCAASQATYGLREWRGETKLVGDEATAFAVLRWMVDAYADATETVSIQAPEDAFFTLERGAVVVVSDASVGLVRRPALVLDVQPDDSGWLGIPLRLIPERRAA